MTTRGEAGPALLPRSLTPCVQMLNASGRRGPHPKELMQAMAARHVHQNCGAPMPVATRGFLSGLLTVALRAGGADVGPPRPKRVGRSGARAACCAVTSSMRASRSRCRRVSRACSAGERFDRLGHSSNIDVANRREAPTRIRSHRPDGPRCTAKRSCGKFQATHFRNFESFTMVCSPSWHGRRAQDIGQPRRNADCAASKGA